MNSRQSLFILIPILLLLGLIAWASKEIIIYLIVAVVLALIGRPVMRILGKPHIKGRYLPESAKAALTLILLIGFGILLIIIFIPVIVQQIQNLENINYNAVAQSLDEPIAYFETVAREYKLTNDEMSVTEYFQSKVSQVLNVGKLSNLVNGIIGFTGDFLIALFSIIFITFFFLKDKDLSTNIVLALTPNGYEERVSSVMTSIKTLLSRYFIGVLTEILLVGGLISIGLMILGVKYAVVIGFFAGIFNVIPYVGPLIGASMGVALTILGNLQLDFYSQMVPLILKVAVIFMVVQLIDNFVFQPYIYSSSVKAHPLEIFLVILIAGNIAGVGGMILAIPTYTILRVVAKEFLNQFKFVQSITKDI